MSTQALTGRWELDSLADTALKAAARAWFAVALIGQFLFAFSIASFYGLTALRGDLKKWSRFMPHGYVSGDTLGNGAVAMHLASAAVVMLAGALQLVPRVRDRFPSFHRWNGRMYMLTAVTASVAGLYMLWIRGSVGDLSQYLGATLNAVLIWVCAAMALRHALARDFKAHRPWALRLFLVVSATWFTRLGLSLSFLIFKGPFGFDPTTFRGPFLTFLAFAQYAVPLAVLEIYLRAQERGGSLGRVATAALLLLLTVATGAGIFAVTAVQWVPRIKAGFDPRQSIADTLSATIAASGIDQAAQQYRDLRAERSAGYDFDETELNNLGYQLIRARKFKEAIRIFQLNVESYPQSSNVYDSLGEAYMDDGNHEQAVANYQRAVQIDPRNSNAALMLKRLSAP
jgi:tetratricopeptide (TPR) repeat protein